MTYEQDTQGAIDNSPLKEADPLSLDILFERINQKLAAGLPEQITDDELFPVVLALRKQRSLKIEKDLQKLADGPKTRKAKPKTIQEALIVQVGEDDL
jgi:hypothetical protein